MPEIMKICWTLSKICLKYYWFLFFRTRCSSSSSSSISGRVIGIITLLIFNPVNQLIMMSRDTRNSFWTKNKRSRKIWHFGQNRIHNFGRNLDEKWPTDHRKKVVKFFRIHWCYHNAFTVGFKEWHYGQRISCVPNDVHVATSWSAPLPRTYYYRQLYLYVGSHAVCTHCMQGTARRYRRTHKRRTNIQQLTVIQRGRTGVPYCTGPAASC